jgi:subtilisin-like proprotein convertase family protein
MTHISTSRLTGLLCCICLLTAIIPTLFSASGVHFRLADASGVSTTLAPSLPETRKYSIHPEPSGQSAIRNLQSAARQTDVCPRPELLQANQVTDSTARLTWSDVGDKYEVELAVGADPFTGMPTYVVNSDPPFDINGLTPGRNYRFQVRTVCDDTTSSVWSNPRSFITDLNNARPCPLNLDLRDTSCNNIQVFKVHVDSVPGLSLGADVLLRGVRIAVEHPWRSDLSIWLVSPDSTRIQLIGGLNAGDQNIGDPQGADCAQFVELTDNATVGQALSTAAEKDNITGYYLPVEALTGLHTSQNPVGVWQLEICDSKVAHRGKLLLFELVFARADCAEVENVVAGNVTENSAEISWQTDAIGDSLLLEYGPVGFIPGTAGIPGAGAVAILVPQPASAPIPLTGLQTLQGYEVYIRRQCAPGVWGPNSYSARFFTNCAATLLETVDTLPTCSIGCADPCPLPGLWQNVPDDDYEWKVFNGPGLAWPVAGPASTPDGAGNYLYFRNACSPTGAFGKTAVLRTLCVAVSAHPAQACHFSFDLYMNTKINQPGTLMLQASTDGGLMWDTVQTWSGNQGKRWRREYVNLSVYDGQTALFQFVATGVFGAYGDLAMDNLAFYGSQGAGTPDYEFYADTDGDTFGDPDVRVISCFPVAPPGYVSVDSDCDDADPAVYPGAPEILCNQKDENCNGMADDMAIPMPAAPDTVEICAGSTAVLAALGTPAGQYFWYADALGGAPVAADNTLTINGLTASATYYLADSLTGPAGGCASGRTVATVVVHPVPFLTLNTAPAICDGNSFNLATLPVVDTANAGGLLTYHSATPPGPANELPSPVVQPGITTNYYLRSTTVFGCTGTRAVTITVLPSPEVQIAQGDSVNVCRGRTLQLQALESGVGAPPIEYAWSTGLNFPNIPVPAGNTPDVTKTYTVTVTDANGCTGTDQIKVHTLNNVTQTALVSVQNVGTCGGNDGSITLNPLNGTPPYTFAWSGGTLTGVVGTGTITGLAQGSYRITVTDATNAGCSMVMPQIVLNAPGLDVSLDTIIHPACPGAATGSIVLNVNGLNPVFDWSDMQTGSTATGLSAGLYSVTITDGNCSQVLSKLEVTAPPPIDINLNTLKLVQCSGESNGIIDLAVFGATPPYQFLWSNDATSEDLTNLPAGTYQSTITDANGCTFPSPEYIVTEPPLLNIILDSVLNVRCFGEESGYLCVDAIGGAGSYQYNWSTGAKTACLPAVGAGVYFLTVTDGNACTAEWLGVVTQSSSLQIEFTKKQNPTCIGAKDGNIELIITGGTPPFQFQWNNNGTTAKIENLGVGTYRATITDAKGCTLVSPVVVLTAPQMLGVMLDTLANVGCRGDATGLIGVSVSGAVGNITTTWNAVPDDLTLSNALAGVYILQVTDGLSCSIKDTFVILEPEASLAISVQNTKNALCSGEPTGSISIRVNGGTAPYTYIWSNGAHTPNLPAVVAGTYGLTVIDANGCSVVMPPLTIGEPPAIVVAPEVHDIPCFGVLTGDILLTVSGGIPPYQYNWSNSKKTQNIFGLAAGAYTVTVQDATGCANVLTDLTVIDRNINFLLEPLIVQPVSCSGANDGKIAVRVVNGTGPYQYAWSPPIGLHPNVPVAMDTISSLNGGDYWVTVTDAAGCTAVSAAFNVEEAPSLQLVVTNIADIICKGDSTGQVSINVSGGLPPYNYLWNNGLEIEDLVGLPAGSYQVTATDLRGCTVVSTQSQVLEPALPLSITLNDLKDDKCGKQEGSVQLTVIGGLTPYQYLWNNMAVTPALFGLSAGTYQLTATDNLGCSIVSPLYTVQQLAAPLVLVDSIITHILCRGDSTGAILTAFTGGTPAYQYAWSTGASTANLFNVPAGNYFLTVSDAAGCFNFWTFPVTQPQQALTAPWTTDSSGTGWQITLSPSGGLSPYNIQWDEKSGNQTGPVAVGLEPGLYRVSITDSRGCLLELSIPVGTFVSTRLPDLFSRLLLAPNPTMGPARLEIELQHPEVVDIRVFNTLGQAVLTRSLEEKKEKHVVLLDLAGHAPGMYWLLVQLQNGQRKTIRLMLVE